MALSKTYLTVNGKIRSEQRSGESGSRDYVLDGSGSVVGVYRNGWLQADACYEPYGELYTQWNMGNGGYRFTWGGGLGYRQTFTEWSSVYVRARHYSKSVGSWLTVDPLWPSEMPYGYVDGRVPRGVDPSGMEDWFQRWANSIFPPNKGIPCLGYPGPVDHPILGSNFKGTMSGECDRDMWHTLDSLCAMIKSKTSTALRKELNSCVANASSKLGMPCPSFTENTDKCLQKFCASGHIDCVETGKDCGKTPGFKGGQSNHRDLPRPESGVIVYMSKNRGKGCPGIGGIRGLPDTLLHEMLHACGVAHGKSHAGNLGGGNYSCNAIMSCCMFNIKLKGRPGRSCWDEVPRWNS